MRKCLVLAGLCATVLGGCAITPQPPGLLVVTTPPGAACRLVRQGGTFAVVDPTPAIARGIEAGNGAVSITCERPGFARMTVAVPPPYPERVDIALAPAPPR
jgi:hypothetical protein